MSDHSRLSRSVIVCALFASIAAALSSIAAALAEHRGNPAEHRGPSSVMEGTPHDPSGPLRSI